MSGNREYLSRIYISALDVTKVFVIAMPGQCKIGFGEPVRSLRDAGDDAKVSFLAWCDPRFAENLVVLAREKIGDQSDPDAAERAILFACEELGAAIQTDAELQATVHAAVDRVDAEFERLLRSGQLRELNAKYREYRLGKNAAGEKAQTYSAFTQAEKVKLVQKTASLVRDSRRMGAKLKAALAAMQPPHHFDAA